MTGKKYPTSFIYVPTKFENQIQNLYASPKVRFFSNYPKPESSFWHQQGHQWEGAFKRSIIISQNINMAINGLEHEKTIIFRKIEKGVFDF